MAQEGVREGNCKRRRLVDLFFRSGHKASEGEEFPEVLVGLSFQLSPTVATLRQEFSIDGARAVIELQSRLDWAAFSCHAWTAVKDCILCVSERNYRSSKASTRATVNGEWKPRSIKTRCNLYALSVWEKNRRYLERCFQHPNTAFQVEEDQGLKRRLSPSFFFGPNQRIPVADTRKKTWKERKNLLKSCCFLFHCRLSMPLWDSRRAPQNLKRMSRTSESIWLQVITDRSLKNLRQPGLTDTGSEWDSRDSYKVAKQASSHCYQFRSCAQWLTPEGSTPGQSLLDDREVTPANMEVHQNISFFLLVTNIGRAPFLIWFEHWQSLACAKNFALAQDAQDTIFSRSWLGLNAIAQSWRLTATKSRRWPFYWSGSLFVLSRTPAFSVCTALMRPQHWTKNAKTVHAVNLCRLIKLSVTFWSWSDNL